MGTSIHSAGLGALTGSAAGVATSTELALGALVPGISIRVSPSLERST
jgi:hypothetical protein